jgi:hypothetical protein
VLDVWVGLHPIAGVWCMLEVWVGVHPIARVWCVLKVCVRGHEQSTDLHYMVGGKELSPATTREIPCVSDKGLL